MRWVNIFIVLLFLAFSANMYASDKPDKSLKSISKHHIKNSKAASKRVVGHHFRDKSHKIIRKRWKRRWKCFIRRKCRIPPTVDELPTDYMIILVVVLLLALTGGGYYNYKAEKNEFQ